MIIRSLFLVLMIFASSCALFRAQDLKNKKIDELISALSAEGEGKGRLGLGSNQYLFSFDAVLKQNSDWLLAASFPLHGEEILIFKNLKNDGAFKAEAPGEFEIRMEEGIKDFLKSQKKSPKVARAFILELRNMMRFVLHKKLGLNISCDEKNCSMGDYVYQVEVSSNEFSLTRSVLNDYEMKLIAVNLTGPIFKRMNIHLLPKAGLQSTKNLLSLELFWN